MASSYATFLQSPSTSLLAADASLSYITSTTSISGPTAILKHLAAHQRQVEKKSENVLTAIEGSDSLFLETETTYKFVQGGGAILPSMDENLLDEKVVVIPLLHVVSFEPDQKIKSIRLHWDQATVLKQVEAIGRTGRNWPIREGKAQIEAIKRSIGSSAQAQDTKALPIRGSNGVPKATGALRNQPATLELFASRDPNEDGPGEYDGPKLAPRDSARPVNRDLAELVAGDSNSSAANSAAAGASPTKAEGVVFKSGAGQHFGDIRLFNDESNDDTPVSPERKKTYEQKYSHFDFGEGEDAPVKKQSIPKRGHKSQPTFSFEDFSTPVKYVQKQRPDDVVHWGGEELPPSPPKRPIVHAARKDAVDHFTIADSGDSPAHYERAKTSNQATATNLYNDPVAAGYSTTPVAASKANTTNTNNSRRGDDFGAHYEIADDPNSNNENIHPRAQRAARLDMEQHWSWGTPRADEKIYKTAGDGMGSRKGANTDSLPDKKIYKTAGDGMGGRRGGRGWSIGDE